MFTFLSSRSQFQLQEISRERKQRERERDSVRIRKDYTLGLEFHRMDFCKTTTIAASDSALLAVQHLQLLNFSIFLWSLILISQILDDLYSYCRSICFYACVCLYVYSYCRSIFLMTQVQPFCVLISFLIMGPPFCSVDLKICFIFVLVVRILVLMGFVQFSCLRGLSQVQGFFRYCGNCKGTQHTKKLSNRKKAGGMQSEGHRPSQ